MSVVSPRTIPAREGRGAESEHVDVVVNSSARAVGRPFTYRVPEALRGRIRPGHEVRVPFGRQVLTGFVVGFNREGYAEAKAILELVNEVPLVSEDLLDLAAWLADRYAATWWEALRLILPRGSTKGRRVKPKLARRVEAVVPAGEIAERARALARRAPAQAAYLEALHLRGGASWSHELPRISPKALHRLVAEGIVVQQEVEVRRDPYVHLGLSTPKEIAMNAAQTAAAALLRSALAGRNGLSEFLLYGVTGSGKTEVYLEAIATAIELGRQAIILVPEISLSCLVAERVKERFGERVAILHSRLSPGERGDEWRRIALGKVGVAVGARSALFAPFESPGLIVIDEEHDGAYKQDQAPRYDAREVARRRMSLSGGVVLLGSATPSLESLARVGRGESTILRLDERVDGRPLPTVRVVDLKEERPAEGLFSPTLLAAIEARLARREQVILFLNRRGFATTIFCRECGKPERCVSCSVPLILHARTNALVCHYCDFRKPLAGLCPNCGSFELAHRGSGTERVEEVLRVLFPKTRILRMDRDTTERRGSHGEILRQFARGEASILVGTQMVAKGLDFPEVSLVGILNADMLLNFPDFRAAERTAQLLIQVAGRAGRGAIPGEVILQTYSPLQPAILAAAAHRYDSFLEDELRSRQELAYPPASHLVRGVVSGEETAAVEARCRELVTRVREEAPEIQLVGPAPAPLERLQGRFRWHFLVKVSTGEEAGAAGRRLEAIWGEARLGRGGVSLSVDVDPLHLL